MTNTESKYGIVSRSIHWLVAIIVITMVLGLFYIDELPKDFKGTFFFFHKSFGVTIFFLVLFRIVWSIESVKPRLPFEMRMVEKILARTVQHALLFLLLLMTLSGWIMATAAGKPPTFFGLFSMPLPFIPEVKALAKQMSDLHFYVAWGILICICLHLLGALKHHFIDKDSVLKSML